MPIGAIIGGAVIGAGGAVASGAMGASAQKHAANTAADTSAANTASNNALYREIYGQNRELLTPFSNNGLLASNALTGLLLGGSAGTAPALTPAPAPTLAPAPTGALASYQNPGFRSPATPAISSTAGASMPGQSYPVGLSPVEMRDLHATRAGTGGRLGLNSQSVPTGPAQYTPTATPALTPAPASAPAPAPAASAQSAWDQFRQGTNYQWRLNEGQRGLTSNWAAHSALDSGAASRAQIEFGQNFASNELGRYMDLLASQQAMGLSAAGAVAGVGTTYAGNVAAQNTNSANAAANAALASGNASAGMWGTVGQTAGQLGGALFQYGMGQQQPQTNWGQTYNALNTAPWAVNAGSSAPLAYMPGGF